MSAEKQVVQQPLHLKAVPIQRVDSTQTVTRDSLKELTPVSSLVEPISNLQTGDPDGLILSELEAKPEVSPVQPVVKQGKRRSRRQRRKGVEEFTQEPEAIGAKQIGRSNGWRQTPLLEPTSFQPFSTIKRRKVRANGRTDDNGWATEDATDVQDLGDFDFQGGLAKFDKRTVFHQIQAADAVADEDRLFAHNRLPRPKPGTAGGKNLHYTENVLDSPNASKRVERWKSEAGDSDIEEAASQKDTGSSRHSRKPERADSRLSTMRRSASRKGSGATFHPTRALSVSHLTPSIASSSLIHLQVPAPSKASFYLVPSDRRCETISALQMLNLENIADHDLGLTEDMMTENAGRGIADVALSALNNGGGSLTHRATSTISNVAVFAGNNKSGLRALAAARQLLNHGVSVVVCVLGIEHEAELLAGLRRQLKVFRGFGGKVLASTEPLKALDSTIDLIIDGLLGLTISFEELRLRDQVSSLIPSPNSCNANTSQTTAYELIEWANRSTASVVAIDVPTGIDPSTGKISVIDGRQLYLHAKYVVAMGAPKKGLLEAMALGQGVADEDDDPSTGKEWQLFVADIGLGTAVWRKAGTRVRRGVEFEGSWVLGMRFQAGVL